MLLADAVAVLHAAEILFVLTGPLLALRWPRALLLHLPVVLAILVLNVTGTDCPLTAWELALRESAGESGYTGGFIGHYITEPLGFPVDAASTQLGIAVVAFTPNVIGYGLLAIRAWRRPAGRPTSERGGATTRTSAPEPGRCLRAPRRRTRGWPAAAPRGGRRTASRTSAPVRR